jgi:glycosyltransferase involved in cell wall biosynthesis
MRIGIDARPLSVQAAGVPKVVNGLVRELEKIDQENSYYLYSHREFDLPFENPRWHKRIGLRVSRLPSIVWFWTEGKRAILNDHLDVFWSAMYIPHAALPSDVATILTVHDLEWRLYPETMSLGTYYAHRLLVWPSVRQAGRIVSDSESTARDLHRVLNIPESRIEVIHLGVGSAYRPQDPERAAQYVAGKYGVSNHYALAVGTVQPRKNLVTLVEAMKILRDRADGSLQLLVAGARGWKNTKLDETIRRLGLTADDIRFLGVVPEEDLPVLYSGSRLFVFPSLYEGFGLPLVEAMACGVPVIASNTSSIPEVVGDAALLVPPTQPEGFAEAIQRVRSDENLRRTMIEKGLSRAGCFGWDKAARQLLECMRKVVDGKRSDKIGLSRSRSRCSRGEG